MRIEISLIELHFKYSHTPIQIRLFPMEIQYVLTLFAISFPTFLL